MLDFIALFFSKIWELFSIKWPGFDFPIGYAFLGVSFSVIALGIVARLLNISLGSAASSVAGAVKGGNNKRIKVPNERKDDTK